MTQVYDTTDGLTVLLAHELGHAYNRLVLGGDDAFGKTYAVQWENIARGNNGPPRPCHDCNPKGVCVDTSGCQ